MRRIDAKVVTELEAAAFRRLVQHLREKHDWRNAYAATDRKDARSVRIGLETRADRREDAQALARLALGELGQPRADGLVKEFEQPRGALRAHYRQRTPQRHGRVALYVGEAAGSSVTRGFGRAYAQDILLGGMCDLLEEGIAT